MGAPAADRDGAGGGGRARQTVGVAKGNEAEPPVGGRHPGSAVGDRPARGHALDLGQRRLEAHDGAQSQFGRRSDGGVGRQSVQPDAGAYQVQTGGGVPQEPAGGGQVAHARSQTGVAHDRLSGAEAGQMLLGGPGVGFISAREVGPQADHLDVARLLSRSGRDGQRRQVRLDGTGPGHAGVDLEVDPGSRGSGVLGAACGGGGGQSRELVGGGHRQVEVGVQGPAQRGAGGRGPLRGEHRGEPAQQARMLGGGPVVGGGSRDAGGVEHLPQVESLGQLSDAEPGGAGAQAGAGHRAQTVPVAVGHDHGHPGHAACLGQNARIVRQRVEVDDGPRGGGRAGPGRSCRPRGCCGGG